MDQRDTIRAEAASSAEAKRLGMKRYFTGRPCINGHVAVRVVGSHKCVQCKNDQKRRAYARNPQKHLARTRAWKAASPENTGYKARYRYGVSAEDYALLVEVHGGQCAICGTLPKRRRHCIDHCHTSKRVRGLLCDKCNTALGLFRDDPNLLVKAAEYLRAHAR